MDKYIQYTPGDPCLDMACVGVCVVMLYPGDELRRASHYSANMCCSSISGEVAGAVTLLPRPIMIVLVTEDVDYKRI